ncbi:unnamed protein product [Caenorhabditis brenneri]
MKLQFTLPLLFILMAIVGHSDAKDEPNTELGKQLKEHLDEILARIKDALDHGKTVKEDTLVKLKEIREKLKDMRLDAVRTIKEKIKERIQEQKDKFNGTVEANP